MTPNPGGSLAPDQVVGRDREIERYWHVLSVRSLVLLAPRRVGKSSVCRRMNHIGRGGFVSRYRDLEGLTSDPWDFVKVLFQDTERLLSRWNRAATNARSLLQRLGGGVETAWATLTLAEQDWREALDTILNDLDEGGRTEDHIVVLFWDEFPMFIQDLARNDAEGAMRLLDRLRAARQRLTHVRMVYTGSIGLEEVIGELRALGYTNDPTNDMAKELLDLMGDAEAQGLATRLVGDPVVAGHMAGIAQGHPFLIQHIAERLRGKTATIAGADEALESLVDDPADPLELAQYLDRLDRYADRDAAVAVLDGLAVEAGQDVGALATSTRLDREQVVQATRALRRDLYLVRSDGRFSFRLEFLRRWWALERGL